MKKRITTIVLVVAFVLAIVWACKSQGLNWFPGFFTAICCCIGIIDVNNDEQSNSRSSR